MPKTTGKDGRKYCFKEDTVLQKFAAIVGGGYMETSAVNRGQANVAFKSRYNNDNNRQESAYVKIEPTPVRSERKSNPNTQVNAIRRDDPRILPPARGFELLESLLNRK